MKRDGSVGTGPYTMQYRQELLTSLTDLQEEVGMELISENEVNIIKQIWNELTREYRRKYLEGYCS